MKDLLRFIRFLLGEASEHLVRRGKTYLGFLSLLAGAGCLAAVALRMQGRFWALFLLPVAICIGFFLYRKMLERVSSDLLGNTFEALTAVVIGLFSVIYVESSFFRSAGNDGDATEAIVLLIGSSFFWILGHVLCFRVYPIGSAKLFDIIRRELQFKERTDCDWLRIGKTDYRVDVFRMHRIPYDINSADRDTDVDDLDHVLTKFYAKGREGIRGKQRVLILLGAFGTGKSSALIGSCIKSLRSPLHGANIPCYIKLRDWYDKRWEPGSSDLIRSGLEALVEIYAPESNETDQGALLDMLADFHQKRRITYIFDGLNELLQIEEDPDRVDRQDVQNIVNRLLRFCAGNNCVFSFYPMPGRITSQSMMIDDPGRLYEIYGIRGVHHSDTVPAFIGRSVALYRLYEETADDLEKDKVTQYELLQRYIETLILSGVSDSSRPEECTGLFDLIMEKNPDFFVKPYRSFGIDFNGDSDPLRRLVDDLCTVRILQRQKAKNGQNEYLFCHIMVLKYVAADWIIRHLDSEAPADRERIKALLVGDGMPNYLDQLHIADTLKMILKWASGTPGKEPMIEALLETILPAKGGEGAEAGPWKSDPYLTDTAYFIASMNDPGISRVFEGRYGHVPPDILAGRSPEYQVTLGESGTGAFPDVMKKDYPYVGLKRQWVRRTIGGDKPYPADDPCWYRYCMEEYISDLKKPGMKKPKAVTGGNGRFLRLRRFDIGASHFLYALCLLLNAAQIAILLFRMPNDPSPMSFPGAFIFTKILAIAFCIGSLYAWIRQQSNRVEVYGIGLGNISETVPMDELLNMLISPGSAPADNRILIDWLKNRPSLVIHLFCLFTFLWVGELAGGTAASLPSSLARLPLLFPVYLILIVPWSTWVYHHRLRRGDRKEKTERIRLFGPLFLIFAVFYAAPFLLESLPNKWLVLLCIVALGFLVYGFIGFRIWKKTDALRRSDRKRMDRLKRQGAAGTGAECLSAIFNSMSSSCQLRYLEWYETALRSKDGPALPAIQTQSGDGEWKPKTDRVLFQMMQCLDLYAILAQKRAPSPRTE